MKRFTALLLSLVLLTGFSACGPEEPGEVPRLRGGMTCESLAARLAEAYGMRDAVELGLTETAEVLHLRCRDLEAGCGLVSAEEGSPDHIIFLKPKKGREKRAVQALADRLAFEQRAMAAHLSGAGAKAEAGRVFTVGETCVLLILGRPEHDPAAEADAAEKKVRAAFSGGEKGLHPGAISCIIFG